MSEPRKADSEFAAIRARILGRHKDEPELAVVEGQDKPGKGGKSSSADRPLLGLEMPRSTRYIATPAELHSLGLSGGEWDVIHFLYANRRDDFSCRRSHRSIMAATDLSLSGVKWLLKKLAARTIGGDPVIWWDPAEARGMGPQRENVYHLMPIESIVKKVGKGPRKN